jgi:hypothetical protein
VRISSSMVALVPPRCRYMKLGVSYPLNNQAHELLFLMATFAGGHWLRIACTNGTFYKILNLIG